MRISVTAISVALLIPVSNVAVGEDLVEVYSQALRNDPAIRERVNVMQDRIERYRSELVLERTVEALMQGREPPSSAAAED